MEELLSHWLETAILQIENYNATDEEIDIQLMENSYVIDGKL